MKQKNIESDQQYLAAEQPLHSKTEDGQKHDYDLRLKPDQADNAKFKDTLVKLKTEKSGYAMIITHNCEFIMNKPV